jgi:hypothetical protein
MRARLCRYAVYNPTFSQLLGPGEVIGDTTVAVPFTFVVGASDKVRHLCVRHLASIHAALAPCAKRWLQPSRSHSVQHNLLRHAGATSAPLRLGRP